MEVHLPDCYVGAAGSHCHPNGHKAPHLHGMEPGEGMDCYACAFSVLMLNILTRVDLDMLLPMEFVQSERGGGIVLPPVDMLHLESLLL